jgi:amino acid transporter
MMSYTRLPLALAADGLAPKMLERTNRRGAPFVSIAACAVIWALALRFTFERLISIDLVLYGASLLLEFVALAVLRWREPDLPRPFRIPGGIGMAIAIGIAPAALIFYAIYAARDEHVLGMPAMLFASTVAASGAVVYLFARRLRRA